MNVSNGGGSGLVVSTSDCSKSRENSFRFLMKITTIHSFGHGLHTYCSD